MAVLMYLLAALSGATFLAAGAPPGSVERLLPGPLVLFWYAALCVGGVIGLVAAAWRGPLVGVMIERAAMIPLAGGALAYVIALALLAQLGVLFTAGVVGAFGTAAVLRAVQITRQLRALHAVAKSAAKAAADDDQ